ncbi:aminotransferase class I/II-fold pyridoxal phosphate-dependent enzyme [bacterium]|nr:aminotransferase class I/II-fold pyridoxal phosphate-dependent enzyme [bacterium]
MSGYRNPALTRLPAYEPGKPIEELAREKGLSRIVKLASNENPLGPSPKARAAYLAAAEDLHRYPDNDARALAEAVAASEGIEPGQIVFGTGSDDAMHLAVWAFARPGGAALVPQPGFLGYPIFAERVGVTPRPVAMPDYAFDLDRVRDAAKSPDVTFIFLASANSPTGTALAHDDVDALLSELRGDITVLLDLAYVEFDPDPRAPRMAELIDRHPNLLCCRTFSKAHGLAGLRLGYVAASTNRARDIARMRTPFCANGPALAAAAASLGDAGHLARSHAVARDGVAFWTSHLAALGFDVVPSRANFVMALWREDVRAIYEALLDRGVILRRLHAFGVPNGLRITAGTDDENRFALDALAEAVKG